RASAQNAKPISTLVKIAGTSILLPSFNAPSPSPSALGRKTCETVATSSWLVHRSNARPGTPVAGMVTFHQRILPTPAAPSTICSRSDLWRGLRGMFPNLYESVSVLAAERRKSLATAEGRGFELPEIRVSRVAAKDYFAALRLIAPHNLNH